MAIFTTNNRYFISFCINSLTLWDCIEKQPIKTLESTYIQCIDIITDKNILVTSNQDQSVRFYSLNPFKLIC